MNQSKENTLTFNIMQVFVILRFIALSILFCTVITRVFFFPKAIQIGTSNIYRHLPCSRHFTDFFVDFSFISYNSLVRYIYL